MKEKTHLFNWKKEESQKLFESNTPHFEGDRFKIQGKQLIKNFKLRKSWTILDYACGIGKHAIELHKAGFDVCGYDSSKHYIGKAKQLSKNLIPFYITFGLMKDFDFIYTIDFPIAHVTSAELRKIFKSINISLKKGSYFLFGFTYTRENREHHLPIDTWNHNKKEFYLTDQTIKNGKATEKYIIIDKKKCTITKWIQSHELQTS